MKVLVTGDLLSTTGYACHLRGLLIGLERIGMEPVAECGLPAFWDRHPVMNDELIKIVKREGNSRDVTVCVDMPSLWAYKLSDRPKKFFGFLVWEGDRIPKDWVGFCNDERVDGILVPSNHVLAAAKNSGVTKPVYLVPHGVDLNKFKRLEELKTDMKQLKDDNKCSFLFHKGWVNGVNDRSGFDILVRAFNEEFKEEDKVRLIAHVNPAYSHPRWNFGLELQKLGLGKFGFPLVHIENFLTEDKLVELYNIADFIVSCSKAEGFNLSILEGMACGAIPIVPNNGGEVDYVNETNGVIYSAEQSIPATGGFLYEGINWKLPDKESLKKALRGCYDKWKNDKEWLKKKQEECGKTVKEYTWEKTAEKIKEIVKG